MPRAGIVAKVLTGGEITGMNLKAGFGALNPPLRGIVPNSKMLLDNSAKKLQYALLLKF